MTAPDAAAPPSPDPRVRVWDSPVRLMHWGLAASVALSALALTGAARITAGHQPAGYAALAIVTLRILWGVTGSRFARLAQFMRGPAATWAYARRLAHGDEPRYLGHNPLGAWMAVALIGCITGLALSGWLYTTDWFFGSEAVEDLHRALARGLLALVLLHVAGVIFTSIRHRENLVRAMVDGFKRRSSANDID